MPEAGCAMAPAIGSKLTTILWAVAYDGSGLDGEGRFAAALLTMKATSGNSRGARPLPQTEWTTLAQLGNPYSARIRGPTASIPLRSPGGWDPYEVWCTRIRTMDSEARVGAAACERYEKDSSEDAGLGKGLEVSQGVRLHGGAHRNSASPNKRPSDRRCLGPRGGSHARGARRVAEMFVWVSLVLAVVLGLSRALVGLAGVDVIAIVFGVMTPAARAIYALLGVAAVYCAIVTALSHAPRRAGR